MNSLTEYFNQKKRRFQFYVVFQGNTPGVFHSWNEVIQAIQNFPQPLYKRYNVLQEALEAARLRIGANYYVTPSLQFHRDDAVSYSVVRDTEKILFCDHCQTMTNTVKKLNEKGRIMENEIWAKEREVEALIVEKQKLVQEIGKLREKSVPI